MKGYFGSILDSANKKNQSRCSLSLSILLPVVKKALKYRETEKTNKQTKKNQEIKVQQTFSTTKNANSPHDHHHHSNHHDN